MNKISVLMSVYKNDNADFLKLALKSIYEDQTVKPDEIVVVCDGPLTPQLDIVIEKFSNDKKEVVNILRLEKNGGLGNALKVGSQYCSYEYIMRMDADDISDRYRFEKQLKYMETHPNVDVLGTYIAEFNKSPKEEDMRVRIVPENLDGIKKMAKKRNPMNHVSVCIKKSALLKCGGYKTLLLLEDYYLWLNMIVAGCNLANIPESLVYVRVGNGFDSKRGSKERIIGWKVLQNFMIEHGMINRLQATLNMFYIWAFVNMSGSIKHFIYKYLLRK